MAYDHKLDDDEKKELLRIARATLREFMRTGRPPPGKPHRECLVANAGAFVTLHHGKNLRGCIGYIEGIKPLVDAVVENGRSAAVSDPRFSPVAAEELSSIEIEVSALTPLVPVARPEEIVIGRHGVVMVKMGRRAVFLPQVAPEQGWDRDTTLTHLALKAGLEPDAWRQGSEFLVFEADVF